MATFSLCERVPGAIAPLVGEQLIRAVGFPVFFGLANALIVASAIVVSFVVEPPHPIYASGDAIGSRSDGGTISIRHSCGDRWFTARCLCWRERRRSRVQFIS
jgi:hypothetical protein